MHIKKGDTVKILSGKDRGKTGKVTSLNKKKLRAVVEGLNIYFRHQKPKKSGQKGQKIKLPMPIHISNLMVTDQSTKKSSQTSQVVDEKSAKIRVAKEK